MDPHTLSLICICVFQRERPVLYVTRADGDWCLLCGDPHPDDHTYFRVAGIGHVIDEDPTLREVLDLLPQEEADREFVGGPWTRRVIAT